MKKSSLFQFLLLSTMSTNTRRVLSVLFLICISKVTSEWTWLGGGTDYLKCNYGTKGKGDTTTYPPITAGALVFSDGNQLYTFSGGQLKYDPPTQQNYYAYANDLWNYNFTSKIWTWIGGNSSFVSTETVSYGMQGAIGESSSNYIPSGRIYSAGAGLDSKKNYYVFGGFDTIIVLADLWTFNLNSGNWTWLGGERNDTTAIYPPTMNSTSKNATPGPRVFATAWVDRDDRFWLFGGSSTPSTAVTLHNDLWMYHNGQWFWVYGSQSPNDPGNLNISAPLVPPSRLETALFTDENGHIYIFGGALTSDVWKWDYQTWTLLDYGVAAVVWNGTYPNPGPRYDPVYWQQGNQYYIFSGDLKHRTYPPYSDVWRMEIVNSTVIWTMVEGSEELNPTVSYGTLGVESPSNLPMYRVHSRAAKIAENEFVMFGGLSGFSDTSQRLLNDLWIYQAPIDPSNTTVQNTTEQSTTDVAMVTQQSEKKGMSGGVIAAIVVPICIVTVAVMVLVAWKLRQKRNQSRGSAHLSHVSVQLENVSKCVVKDIRILNRLGGGNFSDVYQGTWQGTTQVALKVLKLEQDMKEFMAEASLLHSLNHPNVVRFIGLYTENKQQYIVTEYMNLGNMADYLQSNKGKFVVKDLLNIALQIAAGMRYLESCHVIHRDLALRNILANAADVPIVKIADLGLGRSATDYYKSESKTIPVKWSAPEVYLNGKSTSKSDSWSFGVVLWEIFSWGRLPYAGNNNQQVIELIESGYRMPAPANMPKEVADLMTKCWQDKPEDRPTFAEIFDKLDKVSPVEKQEQKISFHSNMVGIYHT